MDTLKYNWKVLYMMTTRTIHAFLTGAALARQSSFYCPRLTFYCPKKITAQSNGECRHATGFWLLDRVHPTRYCTDLRVVCVVGASPTFRPPVGCRFPRSRRCSRSTFLGKLSFSGASSLLI